MSARRFFPLLALACACVCDASCSRAPIAEGSAGYALALTGPEGPFRGLVTITATPEPPDGTLEVRFAIDGALTDVDVTPPFTTTLDFTKEWGGPRRVTAIAHRTDGASAEAAIDVVYDPFAPFVTVLAPLPGAHLQPEASAVDAAFLAVDVSGLGSATVRLDDGALLPLPLPSLTLEVPLPAGPAVFPKAHTLAWSIADRAGNLAEGVVPFVQTHERFATRYLDGPVYSLPSGRVLTTGSDGLRMDEVDGRAAWQRDSGDDAFSWSAPTVDGGVVMTVLEGPSFQTIRLERLREDGSTAWQLPVVGSSVEEAPLYVPGNDSVFLLQADAPTGTKRALRVDAEGSMQTLTTVADTSTILFRPSPPDASPAGVALVIPEAPGGVWQDQVRMFDPQGTFAWSVTGQLLQVLTRDALVGLVSGPDGDFGYGVLGPGGSLPLGIDSYPTVAPNGDILVRKGSTLTRLRPDGSVVWEAALPGNAQSFFASRDRVIVLAPPGVRVLDAAGVEIAWTPPVGDDFFGTEIHTVNVTPSGAFHAIEIDPFGAVRAHRVGADGVERWHETFLGSYSEAVKPVMMDERLLLPMTGMQALVRVIEP